MIDPVSRGLRPFIVQLGESVTTALSRWLRLISTINCGLPRQDIKDKGTGGASNESLLSIDSALRFNVRLLEGVNTVSTFPIPTLLDNPPHWNSLIRSYTRTFSLAKVSLSCYGGFYVYASSTGFKLGTYPK